MVLNKGTADPRTSIRYDEHFLTPTQMRPNFKDFYDYARVHPGLMFAVVYTMHKHSEAGLGAIHNACRYSSTQLSDFFGSCDIWGVLHNMVF